MSEKLKPCAHCGGEAQMNRSFDDERSGYAEHWQVSCTECFARSGSSTYWPFGGPNGGYSCTEEAENAAVSSWNRRHQDQSNQSEFERMLSK